jgi:hypothetical protein
MALGHHVRVMSPRSYTSWQRSQTVDPRRPAILFTTSFLVAKVKRGSTFFVASDGEARIDRSFQSVSQKKSKPCIFDGRNLS